jgi:hypothetical protein
MDRLGAHQASPCICVFVNTHSLALALQLTASLCVACLGLSEMHCSGI